MTLPKPKELRKIGRANLEADQVVLIGTPDGESWEATTILELATLIVEASGSATGNVLRKLAGARITPSPISRLDPGSSR